MTRLDFMALCGKYLIDVEIALENDELRQALNDKNDLAVEQILKTEF